MLNEISKNLGPDGKLLPSVCQYRIDNNLCLMCGKPGHIAINCSKKKNSASGQAAKPAAAITATAGTTEAKDNASAGSKN
jgi:hypothetical protein